MVKILHVNSISTHTHLSIYLRMTQSKFFKYRIRKYLWRIWYLTTNYQIYSLPLISTANKERSFWTKEKNNTTKWITERRLNKLNWIGQRTVLDVNVKVDIAKLETKNYLYTRSQANELSLFSLSIPRQTNTFDDIYRYIFGLNIGRTKNSRGKWKRNWFLACVKR